MTRTFALLALALLTLSICIPYAQAAPITGIGLNFAVDTVNSPSTFTLGSGTAATSTAFPAAAQTPSVFGVGATTSSVTVTLGSMVAGPGVLVSGPVTLSTGAAGNVFTIFGVGAFAGQLATFTLGTVGNLVDTDGTPGSGSITEITGIPFTLLTNSFVGVDLSDFDAANQGGGTISLTYAGLRVGAGSPGTVVLAPPTGSPTGAGTAAALPPIPTQGTPTPEPASCVVFGLCLGALVWMRKRQRQRVVLA